MNLLIWFILGGWGSGWPRDPDDHWPRWCIACRLIIGGSSAIIINVLTAAQNADLGFVGMAVISFAAGNVGSRLVGAIINRSTTAKTQ